MSIFTKLGQTIKKASKQISLKNAIKIGTPLLGSIPIAGGMLQSTVQNLSDAHAQKKEAEKQLKLNNKEAAKIAQEQAQAYNALAGQNVATLAAPTVNAFTKGLVTETYANVSNSAKEAAGKVGASVMDISIKEWLKKHLLHIGIGLGCLTAIYLVLRNQSSKLYKNGSSSSVRAHYASINARKNRGGW